MAVGDRVIPMNENPSFPDELKDIISSVESGKFQSAVVCVLDRDSNLGCWIYPSSTVEDRFIGISLLNLFNGALSGASDQNVTLQ